LPFGKAAIGGGGWWWGEVSFRARSATVGKMWWGSAMREVFGGAGGRHAGGGRVEEINLIGEVGGSFVSKWARILVFGGR